MHVLTRSLRASNRGGPIGKAVGTIPHSDVLNLSGVVIAFVVALLTRMFQFHDRISDVLGIRRRFDLKNILIPLAKRVGSDVTEEKELKMAERRDELMHAVFYKYASSRAEKPLVDKHDIEHALNAWSWFWVLVEAFCYFGVGAVLAWCLGSPISPSHSSRCPQSFLFSRSRNALVSAATRGHRSTL